MITRTLYGLAVLGLIILVLVSSINAIAAANTVPPTNLEDWRTGVNANTLKPPECAAINLTNIVVGSGNILGTDGNDLIIGSAGNDTIDGAKGDDCILGGSGDDALDGKQGYNVCLGGPGTDTFKKCDIQIQ